jgi:16S rRNA (adenine1518-N6/adenine1519-N6)-dimethyltransferase
VPTTSTGSSSPGSRRVDLPAVPVRPVEVDAALRRLGVRPSRGLGQSFLTDRFVADALASLAGPADGGPVVEIGGGLGLVTRALLERGIRPLTVLEKDRRLAAHLASTFGPRVRVLAGDARSFDFPSGATVVGSLPYSSATAIVLGLLPRRLPRLAFLLQKEVAERFASGPGTRAYGRPSIVAQLYGSPELWRVVGPEAFSPVPTVASRLWTHTAREGPLPVGSVDRLERLLRSLFGARRKQLRNLLPSLASGREDAVALASEAGWPADWPSRRPEQMAPEAFFRLAAALDARAGRATRDPPEETTRATDPRDAAFHPAGP